VIFTSDNGPWASKGKNGGVAGPLRGSKGCTLEGGVREPTIAWWPGSIPAGTVSAELGTTMDIYATSIALVGGEVPKDRVVDGVDLTSTLTGKTKSPRDEVYYYRGTRLMAIRKGPWKAHFMTQESYTGNNKLSEHDPPILHNLEIDPGEKWNVAEQNPKVIEQLKKAAADHRETVKPVPSQLESLIK